MLGRARFKPRDLTVIVTVDGAEFLAVAFRYRQIVIDRQALGAYGGGMTPLASDTEWYEHAIQKVETHDDGYTLSFDDGLCLGCPKVDSLAAPAVGETIRLYGRGFGYAVRGIVISGRVFRYETKAQEQARFKREQEERDTEAENKLLETVEETDRRILALPEPLRERILKFQREGGHEFRRDLEGYELFCCEQAVVIAAALKTADAIKAFHALPWEEQKAAVPDLGDGHSGNTFGAACMLARLLIESPEHVTQMQGALAPLVGSKAYGR